MVILDAVILVAVFLLFKELTAVSYDPEHLTIRGISPIPFQFLILILTALTVVISMKVVGLIMIIALLSLPVATGEIYFHSLWKIMITASIVGMISTISGLFLSYYLDLTSGPVIILTAAAIYILALLHKRFLHAYSKI